MAVFTGLSRQVGLIPTEALTDTELEKFIGWFEGQRTGWRKSSFRQYKAASLYALRQLGEPDDHPAVLRLQGMSQDASVASKGRTSSAKVKRLPPEDLNQIIQSLRQRRSKYAGILERLLIAGVAAGLRPCEWKSAQVHIDDHASVFSLVENAKHSNGRAFGPVRTLRFDELSPAVAEAIALTASTFGEAEAKGDTKTVMDGLEKLMSRTCRDLWPKRSSHYCLYSARHQFAANAKLHMSQVEVAALMGHASIKTAGQHYGRRVSGRSKIAFGPTLDIEAPLPSPAPENLDAVRKLNTDPGEPGIPAPQRPR